MKKLPPINLIYWVFIISSTTLGETAGDLISQTLDLGYGMATLVIVGMFALAVAAAVLTKVQHAALYWIVIILASIGGTTLSDYVSRTLDVGYLGDTLVVAAALGVVMVAWRMSVKSLALDSPLSRWTEILYWAAILISSTLGTALGDLLSNGTAVGFGGGTLVLLGLLAVVGALALFTKVSRAACYWLGIVITHPLGATMGDYMTKEEGFNLGNIWSSVILLGVFAAIVAGRLVMASRRRRRELGTK